MSTDSQKVQEAKKITLPELYNRVIGFEQQTLNALQRILMQQELQTHMDVLRAKTLLDTIRVPTAKEREYQQELTLLKQFLKDMEGKYKDSEIIRLIITKIDELSKSKQAIQESEADIHDES